MQAWKWKISTTEWWEGASEWHAIVLINHQPCPHRVKCITMGAYGSAQTKPGFATVPSVLRTACRASVTVSGRGATAVTGRVCWRVRGCAYRVATYQARTLYCTPLRWKLTAYIEDFRFSYNLQVAVTVTWHFLRRTVIVNREPNSTQYQKSLGVHMPHLALWPKSYQSHHCRTHSLDTSINTYTFYTTTLPPNKCQPACGTIDTGAYELAMFIPLLPPPRHAATLWQHHKCCFCLSLKAI